MKKKLIVFGVLFLFALVQPAFAKQSFDAEVALTPGATLEDNVAAIIAASETLPPGSDVQAFLNREFGRLSKLHPGRTDIAEIIQTKVQAEVNDSAGSSGAATVVVSIVEGVVAVDVEVSTETNPVGTTLVLNDDGTIATYP